jgi:UPF0176 protein
MKPRLHNRVNREILKQQLQDSVEARTTVSFYHYTHLENPQVFRDHFYLLLDAVGVKGRIYVAKEGINAQISVPANHWDSFLESMNSIAFLRGIRLNTAIDDDGKSFFELKIQVKSKIVADGLHDGSFDVTDIGTHLNAQEFNALTDDPDTILVDMRNHYESEVGHFEGAICPDVETFREELPVVENILRGNEDKNIVMYCTGGIRCEKASAYYKHKGFKNVFQLNGGIIEYARQVEAQGLQNKFRGVNFVFDERLGERISEEVISNCHQCGTPCDAHNNCANEACHILFIQCPDCAAQYQSTCSTKCQEFILLPVEEQVARRKTESFNGTKFGKGRYKANHAGDNQLRS